jgi:hypothetical protein
MEGFDDFGEQLDDAAGRVELAAPWPSVMAKAPRKYS